jgi:hypothetical protein
MRRNVTLAGKSWKPLNPLAKNEVVKLLKIKDKIRFFIVKKEWW